MPRLAVSEDDPRTVVIDLSERLAPACIGGVWLRDREIGGALGQFLDLLLQVCAILERQQGKALTGQLAA